MSFSFPPLSTQVTNSCSSSLSYQLCCLNPSVSFISWSVISICLLLLFCSFSDLFATICTSYFYRADWTYWNILEETLNSWSTVLSEMRWHFTFWCDVIVNVPIFWFTRFLFTGSRSHMFYKIGVLKSFANSTGKQLCWSLFLIKLQASNLLKKDSNTAVFLRNLRKI